MAYVPTTFVDRSVEFANRRRLTAVPGQADTFDVARAEGTVFAEGTKPDAANLNAEFGKIKTETDRINTNLTAPTVGMFIYDYQNGSHGFNTSPTRGADTFIPFKSAVGAITLLIGGGWNNSANASYREIRPNAGVTIPDLGWTHIKIHDQVISPGGKPAVYYVNETIVPYNTVTTITKNETGGIRIYGAIDQATGEEQKFGGATFTYKVDLT